MRETKTYSADTMGELEFIWQNKLMNTEWDIKKPISLRWSWFKFSHEFYFVVKKNPEKLKRRQAHLKTIDDLNAALEELKHSKANKK